MKQQFMDLNRETAMRLWNKSFGKDTKAVDFAGRTIAKGAYNDRNSEFGWNVDHILPQSKGGATADYNLICCHIKTNDEKADKFPCFNANEIAFEIVKVQNHYEIRAKSKKAEKESNSGELDLFDSASGVRFFKKLKGVQNKKRFVGTVFIKLYGLNNTAVVDFIEELMDTESLSFKTKGASMYGDDLIIVAHSYNMPLKDDISELLDKCVLLNTYLSKYFTSCEYIKGFDIYYRVDCFDDKFSMYKELENVQCPNVTHPSSYKYQIKLGYQQYYNSLFVNGLVLENTEAGDKVTRQADFEYTEYNFVFTKLSENLKKEASGK
ncbi:MAG: HNH endonuclease [Clostridia bacterium]|nr:HNH endonuclease [Clostridia bacterium]